MDKMTSTLYKFLESLWGLIMNINVHIKKVHNKIEKTV